MILSALGRIARPLLLLSSLCLVSCVSTRQLPLADPGVLSRKTAAQTTRELPAFGAVTPGKAAVPVVGAVTMITSGNTLVRDNQVEDPANWISDELAAAIARKHGTSFRGKRKVSDESPGAIASACAGADYALDVRTINWSFAYFPVNWATYRVIYSAKLRLIDCKSGKVIAEGFHARVPDKTDQSPGYDGLMNNRAAGLKKELRIGASEALYHFKQNILKL